MTLCKLCFTLGLNKTQPFAAILFYILSLIAITNSFPQSRYNHYSAKDGLSQLNVRSILQDKQGFIWVGTWDGLNRFDGYRFKVYQHDPTDSSSIANNNVFILNADKQDRLWILFPDGRVNIYNKRTGEFRLLKNQDGSALVSSTYHVPQEDNEGFLWTGLNDTLRRIDPNNFAIQSFPAKRNEALPSGRNPQLVLPDERKMYFIYGPGEVYVQYTDVDFISQLVTSDGRIMFATARGELFEYQRQYGSVTLLATLISPRGTPPKVNSLYQDSRNQLWAGTSEGLYICQNINPRSGALQFSMFAYYEEPEKSGDPVYSVFEDYSGVIWVGSTSGLHKVNPVRKNFTFLPSKRNYLDLFGNSFPAGIHKLENGALLIGTTNGLYEYNPLTEETVKFTQGNSGYSGQPAFFIYKSDSDIYWIASREGLSKFEARLRRFKNYIFSSPDSPVVPLNRFYAAALSDDGRIWAGGPGGLLEFNPVTEKYRFHTFPSKIRAEGSSYILSLIVEGDTLWAGTNGEGLLKISLKDMSYSRFSAQPGSQNNLSGNKIMALHRDRKGRLWIATMGGGLSLLSDDEKSFRRFSAKKGLSNNTIYGILEDNNGDIWISTNAGLNRINGLTFEVSVFGSNVLQQITEFNQNSYFKSPDGRLYFGGMRGIISFSPAEIEDNPFKPRIAVTDFLLFNKPRPEFLNRPEITLNYNENFFSFELAALLYDQPGSNQYAYRLKGQQDEWIYLGTRRTVDLSYIEPGEYIFAVKAANEDGLWSQEQELARVTIIPPFWRTAWFYSLAGLFIISGIVISVRQYIRKKYKERIAELEKEKLILEERNRTRDRIARDLHDDLASTVSSAGLYLQSARQMFADNQDAAMQYLEKSTSILSKAEQSMSDIVWSVSPNYDTLDNLLLRIRLIAQELCTAADITLEFTSSGELSSRVSEELRRNIYLAAKECIANAVKHSSCSLFSISAAASSSGIEITLTDNGKGFAFSEPKSSLGGNGLKNIRRRLEEINGTAAIISEPGKGTVIILTAPLFSGTK